MLEKMRQILAEQFNCEEDTLTEETNFKVMALEEEYSIEIPADDLTNLTTVGSVIDYLKDKGVEA